MPPLTQVVSEEAIRQTAESISQENLVFRSAFRDQPIPDRTGNTYSVPVREDKLGEPAKREPGADIDFGREEYRKLTFERDEFASGSRLTEEELQDSAPDILENHVQAHSEKMAEKLDREAFKVLFDAATEPAPSDDITLPAGSNTGDDMSFNDVVDASEVLESRESGFSPDTLFVGTEAKSGLIRNLSDKGTDLGDNTIQEGGLIANYSGYDIMYSNNDLLTDNDGILVDTEYFGLEGEWMPINTDTSEDFDSKTQKLSIRWQGDWIATEPRAAVRVRG
jgi:hypothetical protein